MALPGKVEYLVIGAGVHGLSTAYHLAKYLKAGGKGAGEDVLVIEKGSIAAGASGVACGNVRCNYYQEPMTKLMIHCMDIWESDPDYFAYNSVGYLTASFEPMREGLEAVHARHQQLGYPSTLVTGEKKVKKYMQGIFHDWQPDSVAGSDLFWQTAGQVQNLAHAFMTKINRFTEHHRAAAGNNRDVIFPAI